MRKLLKRLKKEEKGFTLIELLAVIVILAVIAVIAVPLIGKIINNSKTDSDLATARQLYDAARLYVTGEQNGDYSAASVRDGVSFGEIKNNYIPANTVLPSSKTLLGDTTAGVEFDTNGNVTKVTLDASHIYLTAAILGDSVATPTPTASTGT
jgi:type IV pilus assembly protein PilA